MGSVLLEMVLNCSRLLVVWLCLEEIAVTFIQDVSFIEAPPPVFKSLHPRFLGSALSVEKHLEFASTSAARKMPDWSPTMTRRLIELASVSTGRDEHRA